MRMAMRKHSNTRNVRAKANYCNGERARAISITRYPLYRYSFIAHDRIFAIAWAGRARLRAR